METLENSLRSDSSQMELLPTSYVAGSPVRTSQRRESALELMTKREAGFGRKSSDLLARYDHGSSSWKTYQICFLAQLTDPADGSAEFSETWPRSGSMRNGIVSRLPTLAHCTNATACGSSLIPTPTACDFKGSGLPRAERGPKNNLRDWFKWHYRLQYPPVTVVEWLMGFPTGHTDLNH